MPSPVIDTEDNQPTTDLGAPRTACRLHHRQEAENLR
jgi:hypothetical protein